MDNKIFNSYNHLIESSDIERLRKIISRYELYKLSKDIPGDIFECGVFKGTGHIFWLKLLKIYEPNSIKQVIGFDTFSSFPVSTLEFEKSNAKKFVKETNYNTKGLMNVINNKIKKAGLKDRSKLIKGDIVKTSKQYCKDNRGFRISLLHLDLDTYEGTKHALNNFFPYVSHGGVIVFDEYGMRGWGESEAVDEYFKDKKYKIKTVPNSTKPTAFIIKE